MPYKRDVPDDHVQQVVGDARWLRGGGNAASPGRLVLDGSNKFIKGKEKKHGPNGYAVLEFDGPNLVEVIYAAEGTELLRTTLA